MRHPPRILSVVIHFLIVFHILAGYDFLPPAAVIKIPLNGFYNTVIKFGFRQPAKLIMYLSRINRISKVMSLSVGNICNKCLLNNCHFWKAVNSEQVLKQLYFRIADNHFIDFSQNFRRKSFSEIYH